MNSSDRSSRLIDIVEFAAVAMVAIGIFANTWSFDFTYLDDDDLILEQRDFLTNKSSVFLSFERSHFGGSSTMYYRPIITLSYVLDAMHSDVSADGYHRTNILLHGIASMLVLALLRTLRLGPVPSLLGAVLFAVHPSNVESVAWIPGRNDILLTVFVLAACLCLLMDARNPRVLAKIGHLAFFFLALLSKETALCAPAVFAALLWSAGFNGIEVRRPWTWLGWVSMLVLYGFIRSIVSPPTTEHLVQAVMIALHRLPVALADIGKLFLPVHLQVLAAPKDIWIWPGMLAASAIAAAMILHNDFRNRTALSALTMMVLPILISLPGTKTVVLENRLYLSTAGACLLMSLFVQSLSRRGTGWSVKIPLFAGGALVVAFAIISFRYSLSFKDRQSFARSAIGASPNSGLATHLMRDCYTPPSLKELLQRQKPDISKAKPEKDLPDAL